jgi:hypothetical protein
MKIITTILILLFTYSLTAQNSKLKIAISASQLNAKDTLSMEINYTNKLNGTPKDGTLYLKIINNEGTIWNYRWPIYKGISLPQIVMAPDAKQGQYHLYFATRDEQFGINGKVDNVSDVPKLNTIISNKQSLIITSDIEVAKSGSFYYTNPYFVNQAVLKFVNKNKKGERPVLNITSVLDSIFTPTATAAVNINIGEPIEETLDFDLPEAYQEVDNAKPKKVIVQKMVIVKGKKPNPTKVFEDKYISNLFKGAGETTLDVLGDDPGKYGTNVISYLLSNVTSLSIALNEDGDRAIKWRASDMSIFLDEVLVPNNFLENIDLNDIAVIKIFRPPFFGNTNGDGGAIAFFSKKETFGKTKTSFVVNGYSHILSTLSATPKNFW